jgi:hypothetical protein
MILFNAGLGLAQEPPKEMEHFKGDVGTWNCEIRMFGDPSGKPDVSKGSETISMLGGMWMISHFKGEMMGMSFEGSSQMGFNPETKKYTGTWVDSMSPYAMTTEGTWDEKTQTLTQTGTGKDASGNEAKMKMTSVYNKDGSRLFSMFMPMPDGKEMKTMEILYTKAKGGDAPKPKSDAPKATPAK